MTLQKIVLANLFASMIVVVTLAGQSAQLGYNDTPMLPGGKWHVHDGDAPAAADRHARPGQRARIARRRADAVVLFDGSDLSKWRARGQARRLARRGRRDGGAADGGRHRSKARRVRRRPAPPRMGLARPARRQRPGTRQQRRLPDGPLRDPGPRQLRQPDLRRRPGRRDLRPVPAAGQRLAQARRSGRPTTSSSPRHALPTASSSHRRAPRCCTTASSCSTT